MPGIVKAVYSREDSSMGTCQNPAVKSMDENIVLPARLMASMHSLTSNCEYLSICDFLFTALKSSTGLSEPSLFGTRKIGLLYLDLHGDTTPSLN